MEKRIISIDISPESGNEPCEKAGIMWEHNATQLQFHISPSYIGDYRYYIEYRSVLGTKVRTEYLELNTENNTVTYDVSVTMSSLKGVECYFNIVKFDEDGNTIQVIKPKKFGLTFDFSPDTDNFLAKVNDFSVNALLEAIRQGTFKGEKGDRGEKGEIGDKGEQGDGVNSLFDCSVNLYNEATNIAGKVVSVTTGELADNSTYTATDYIYLKAGQYIMTYDNTRAYFVNMGTYDLSKKFIKRTDLLNGSINITEDCFVRFSGLISRVKDKQIMLVKGTELPTEYVPYYIKLKPEHLPEIEADTDDLIVSKEDTDFIKTSGNLINHMTVTKGKTISPTGVLTDSVQYCITDRMILKKSTVYTARKLTRISYFKENGDYIGQLSLETADYSPKTFTTSDDFDYAVLSLPKNSIVKDEWQLYEGDTVPEEFEKQHLVIDGYRLYDEPDKDVDPIEEFKNRDRIVFDKSPLFTLDEDVTVYPDTTVTGQARVQAVYGYYDELMSDNPLYITKTELGADKHGNKLYRYDFKNPDQKHSSGVAYSTAKPKVILISGIHPELSGIYSLFNTMKEITNNPKLKDLKNDIHFIVVPLVNLYGMINGGRKNDAGTNGVDLARNFEIDWGGYEPDKEPTSNSYCGTAPLTEAECIYIDNIMKENADAIFFASCHSFQGSGNKDFIWATVNSKYSANLGEKLVTKLSQEWSDKYDIITTSKGYISGNSDNYFIGTSEVSNSGGTEGSQASKYGIHGGTVEVCDYFHFPDLRSKHLDEFVISRGTETYVNWILLNVYNYRTDF